MTGDVAPRKVLAIADEQARITPAQMRELIDRAAASGQQVRVSRPVVTAEGKRFDISDGSRVGASDGTVYRVRNMNRGGFTLEREHKRPRGKAARRAEKRARAEQRRREAHGRASAA